MAGARAGGAGRGRARASGAAPRGRPARAGARTGRAASGRPCTRVGEGGSSSRGVYRPSMPSPRVLAFDVGGSKLLGGVIADGGAVEHRAWRPVAGLDRDELFDLLAHAVEEARAIAPDAVAVGFGIPSAIDRRRGVSVRCVHLPLDGVAFGAEMERRVGLPVAWDNDANLALLAEHRLGSAGRSCSAGASTAGAWARPGSSATPSSTSTGRRARPGAPAAAASRHSPRGRRSAARERRPGAQIPTPDWGARSPRGGR